MIRRVKFVINHPTMLYFYTTSRLYEKIQEYGLWPREASSHGCNIITVAFIFPKTWKQPRCFHLIKTFNTSHIHLHTCTGSPALANSGDEQHAGEKQEVTHQHHVCVRLVMWVWFHLAAQSHFFGWKTQWFVSFLSFI